MSKGDGGTEAGDPDISFESSSMALALIHMLHLNKKKLVVLCIHVLNPHKLFLFIKHFYYLHLLVINKRRISIACV